MGWGHGGTHASRSLFSSCRIYLFFCDSEPPSLPPSLPLSPGSSPRSSSEPIPPEPFSWAPSSASSSAESFSDPGYAFDNSPYPPSTSSPSRPSSYLVLGRRFPGLHSSLVTPLRAARGMHGGRLSAVRPVAARRDPAKLARVLCRAGTWEDATALHGRTRRCNVTSVASVLVISYAGRTGQLC